MTYMAQELRIGAMVRALHGIDLDNPTARAAAYVRANIDPEDIQKFDAIAARVESIRRVAMADAADQDSQRSAA